MVYTVHCKMYSVQKLPAEDETSEATVKNIYVFIISLMISLAVIFPNISISLLTLNLIKSIKTERPSNLRVPVRH